MGVPKIENQVTHLNFFPYLVKLLLGISIGSESGQGTMVLVLEAWFHLPTSICLQKRCGRGRIRDQNKHITSCPSPARHSIGDGESESW